MNAAKEANKRLASDEQAIASDWQAIGERLASDGQAIETSDRKRVILAYIDDRAQATAMRIMC